MHILAISDYILEDGVVCGATRVLHGYLNELHRQGATISLITLATPPFQETQELYHNYTVYRVRKRFSINLEFDILAACKTACQEASADLCLGHLPFSARYIAMRRYYKSHPLYAVPFMYIFHSPWHLEFENRIASSQSTLYRIWRPIGSFFRRDGEKTVALRSDNIIVLSKYMKQLLTKTHKSFIGYKPIATKTEVIPPGVDYEQFHPGDKQASRDKLGLPKDRLIAFTARSLIPRCGISLALQAMAKVKAYHPEWLLLIAGEGILQKQLEEESEKLALTKNVIFLGNLTPNKLTLYYQAADLFLLPTIELEGFGLVILEAWASALPVLGTPVGAIPEVLSPITPEFILKDCTPDTMFASLKKIADEPEKLSLTGKKCYEYVTQNYSWPKSTEQLLRLFQKK